MSGISIYAIQGELQTKFNGNVEVTRFHDDIHAGDPAVGIRLKSIFGVQVSMDIPSQIDSAKASSGIV